MSCAPLSNAIANYCKNEKLCMAFSEQIQFTKLIWKRTKQSIIMYALNNERRQRKKMEGKDRKLGTPDRF